ncbi:MAG: hypothetical protein ACXQS8_07085 [Candidatus Helarchaeales archaeon]
MSRLKTKRLLALSEIVELVLACEIPIKASFTLLEFCVKVWEVQSRPCYKQNLSSVHEIHSTLIEFMKKNPNKVICLMPELFMNDYYSC